MAAELSPLIETKIGKVQRCVVDQIRQVSYTRTLRMVSHSQLRQGSKFPMAVHLCIL
jgi:hypothetical protein